MAKVIETYGKYAGKVWKTLEIQGSLTPNKLMKATKLNEEDFYVAIGWLAKENKICKTGSKYSLGETNLEHKIGKNAGKIWKTLHDIGYCDAPYLPKISGVPTKEAYCAVGWLAREGKINAKKVKPTTPQLKFSIND
jgi:hypothetical protein